MAVPEARPPAALRSSTRCWSLHRQSIVEVAGSDPAGCRGIETLVEHLGVTVDRSRGSGAVPIPLLLQTSTLTRTWLRRIAVSPEPFESYVFRPSR